MGNDQITQLLTALLIVLIVVLFILLFVFIILSIKRRRDNKPKTQQEIQLSKNKHEQKQTKKKETGYNKQSIFEFMEFDKVEDNMIVRKNGKKYIMAIECQGVNYDLMSGLEKNSVEQGFLQFLNTLRYPIQLYIQTRTVNLESSINTYKQKVDEIKNDYVRKQMQYNSIINEQGENTRVAQNSKFELVRAQNLYEYGLDIIQNTERMNFNKNILKKHYYVIISYMPEETQNSDYDAEEIKNIAFSDLYTKAQAIISSLAVCNINGKVLNSKELIELMYIAYNRDEAEVYELEKAIDAGFDEIYSTAPNVLQKRMKELDIEIEKRAMEKANLAIQQAIENREEARIVKEKEQRMNELIDAMASSILDENEELLGIDTKEEAQKIIRNS